MRILRSHQNQDREPGRNSLAAYADEDLLLDLLAMRGVPLTPGVLRGSILTYLKDAGYAIYREEQPAGPGTTVILFWRITDHGHAVIEGREKNAGVTVGAR